MNRIMTTDELCGVLWDARAAEVMPDDSVFGIYLDPNGTVTVECPYTGKTLHGWPVRRMTGTERVTLIPRDKGGGFHVEAESWILDRIGSTLTGGAARKVRAHFTSFST